MVKAPKFRVINAHVLDAPKGPFTGLLWIQERRPIGRNWWWWPKLGIWKRIIKK